MVGTAQLHTTAPRAAAVIVALSVAAFVAMLATAPGVGAATTARPAANAGDYGYPYPNAPDCNEQTGANCVSDMWGFIQGQCHSWVAYRLNELNAAEFGGATFDDEYRQPAGDEWGNPSNWSNAAARAGITMDTTPALGSVAWWSDDGGHVGYVEAVNADGSIEISEMNADYQNGFDFATLTPGGRWPERFIHIADRPSASTATAFSISVNGAASASVSRGGTVTFAASGLPTDAQGTVTFSTTGGPEFCVANLPATTCTAAPDVGTYQPITARFVDTDGHFGNSSSTNSVTVTVASVVPRARTGYWMLGGNGRVYAFGDSVHYGDAAGFAVAMASRRDGLGYWTVDALGAVKAFGAAVGHGGKPALRAGEWVSTISATPSGNGYWLFTNEGRAFAYGGAHWFGDMAKVHLNGPVVASSATATGGGYYMVGSDGGVFSFGDARFHGSTGGLHLNKPIVGIAPTPDNRGYWLVGSDGGVFAFGARFRGSMGAAVLNKPVNGLVAFGNGYLMVASDGGVFDFSNQPFFGSLAGRALAAPIIGISAFTTD